MEVLKISSCYVNQNAAIWLADEVFKYCDHDTLRCQDNILAFDVQQSKLSIANYGSRFDAKKSTHMHLKRKTVLMA